MTKSSSLLGSLYADRTATMQPSPVRSVFDVSMDPGVISFAGGNPDLSSLPLTELADTAAQLIRQDGKTVMQYGAGAGFKELRDSVSHLLLRSGITASSEEVLITSGSQMGLTLVTMLFCNPNDVILVESPTYSGALSVFTNLEAEVVHVPCDEDGIVPNTLKSTIDAVRASGRTVKFLYVIPNFANPTGILTSLERRQEINDICTANKIAIVEDDPYGEISFHANTPPAIRSLNPNILYLGSVSKVFSPGLRVGWIIAPAEICHRLQIASESFSIHAPLLSQSLAHCYFKEFDWRLHLSQAVKRYQERAHAMLLSLAEFLPSGATWTVPRGGFFIWVTLPGKVAPDALLARAIAEGVVYVPGSAFYANGAGKNQLRLSYSLESPETIREGVRRLARAIDAHTEGAKGAVAR